MNRAAMLAAAYPDVHPLTGERNAYFVDSEVPGSKRGPYLCRLDEYDWNGACGCWSFEYRQKPHLERGAIPSEALRCKHIKRARAYHLDILGPAIDALAPPPARPGRRTYQLKPA